MAREFKLRLPEDVSERIVAKAKQTGWPQNRVIINDLAEYPELKQGGRDLLAANLAHLGDHLAKFDALFVKYGGRIEWLELSEQLLAALDAALDAKGTAQQAMIDKVRVIRDTMRTHEQVTKREQTK
jgi:hypothetical protein